MCEKVYENSRGFREVDCIALHSPIPADEENYSALQAIIYACIVNAPQQPTYFPALFSDSVGISASVIQAQLEGSLAVTPRPEMHPRVALFSSCIAPNTWGCGTSPAENVLIHGSGRRVTFRTS